MLFRRDADPLAAGRDLLRRIRKLSKFENSISGGIRPADARGGRLRTYGWRVSTQRPFTLPRGDRIIHRIAPDGPNSHGRVGRDNGRGQ